MAKFKIRGINKVRSKGQVYWYHRASGRRVDIDPDTKQPFNPDNEPGRCAALVERFNREGSAPVIQAEARPQTLGELVTFYKAGPEFGSLAPATRRSYDIAFQKFAALGFFELPLEVFETHGSPIIIRIRDRVFREHDWWQANYSIAVLRLLFSWAKPYGHVRSNPAIGVPRLKRPRDKARLNRAWSMAEVMAVLQAAEEMHMWGVRAAVALGLARLSRADIVRLPWTSFNGRELDTARHKTGVSLWKPCPQMVLQVLETTPKIYRLGRRTRATTGLRERESVTVVANQHGLPYTDAGLSASFRRLVAALLREGAVQPGLTLHGLGHTVGKWLAESGATTKQIQAFLGHDSPAASEFYLRHASQKSLARDAVDKLERSMNRFAKL